MSTPFEVRRIRVDADRTDRIAMAWPNGRTEEFKDVAAGKAYDCVEGNGITESR
jgi:hypothetical protein